MKSSALFGCQTVLPPPWQEDIGPADIRPAAAGRWGCKKYPRENIRHHIIRICNYCDIARNISIRSNADILTTTLSPSDSCPIPLKYTLQNHKFSWNSPYQECTHVPRRPCSAWEPHQCTGTIGLVPLGYFRCKLFPGWMRKLPLSLILNE